LDGITNVLKPVGMTSKEVVQWLRRKTNASKAGHVGTLDPGAAGVLPVCLGKATRLAEYYTGQSKAYRAEITFGISTDTLDAFGRETSRVIPRITRSDFLKVLPAFLGSIEQIPPMYSAVRKNGRHLYELARQGLEIARETRTVTIDKIDLIEWYEDVYPRALLDIECSKGTYIRTLCQDIGDALGCGAHMSFLLRLRTGSFLLENAYTLEEIEQCLQKNDLNFLLSPAWGLSLPQVNIPSYRLAAFKNGLVTDNLPIQEIIDDGCSVQVFCEEQFIGIAIWNKGSLVPKKVLF